MRVGAGEDLTGPGEATLEDHLVADAAAATYVMEALDPEPFDEGSGGLVIGRVRDGWRRHRVVEEDGDPLRVIDPEDLERLAGDQWGEAVVDHHCNVDVAVNDVPHPDDFASGVSGQDFLNDRHAHGALPSRL